MNTQKSSSYFATCESPRNSTTKLLAGAVTAIALLVGGCGGGGGNTPQPQPGAGPGPQQTLSINGEVIKGTVKNGRVAVFAITLGAVAGTALANGSTDDNGHFVMSIPQQQSGPAVIEVTAQPAGSSPATTMLCDHPAGCGHEANGTAIAFGDAITLSSSFRLRAAVADIASTRLDSVSFFTDLAAAKVLAQSNINADTVRQANDSVRDLFGLGDDITHLDNVDLSVTKDLSALTAAQRRAALLSAGAMGALIGNASDAGAALSTALDRARQQFVAEDGQLIANEGELDDVGVSYADILESTLRVADDHRVVVGSVTDLRAEAERVAQLPAGQRTDGKASPGFAGTERERALAFVKDLRNAVTTFSDPDLADQAAPEEVRKALDVAASDAADAAQPLSDIAMAVVDAVQRFRDGEASPVVSGDVSVNLSTDADTGRTKFDVDHTAGDLQVVMSGSTKGAFQDLDVVDHVKSTEIELDLTAKVNSPGISGEITQGKVTASYSEFLDSISVADLLVRNLPGVVLLPQLASASLDTSNKALGSLKLSLKFKLQQAAAPGIDPLALTADLTIEGADLASFHRVASTQIDCPAYSNALFALSRCSSVSIQDGAKFDALRMALGATVTSAAGRSYHVGIAADVSGAGTELIKNDQFAQTAVVRVPDMATAIRFFGPVTGTQGTQFCCFTPPDAPLAPLTSKPPGFTESAEAFLKGSIAITLETNVAPLDPHTVFSASVTRDTFDGAASDFALDFGGRTLRAHATTDSLHAAAKPSVDLVMESQDGARFTGHYDGDSKQLLDGVLKVNDRVQAHLEERSKGVFVFVFNDGTIESLN